MSREGENEPLVGDGEDVVVATSTGGSLHKTVYSLLNSPNDEEQEEGMVFLRRLWALTVLQYMAILVLASPFSLVSSFREGVESVHGALEVVAVVGIICSLGLALSKGTVYPFARIALVSLTLFAGLEIGLTFAGASWGKCGLVALGQATTSFTVILALLQFESRSLKWLTYPAAALLCLVLSGIWMVVLAESGTSWKVAVGVGLGAWAFAMTVLFSSMYVTHHVAPEEYILGVLFILCPEALVCLSSKTRHPKTKEPDSKTQEYGGTNPI